MNQHMRAPQLGLWSTRPATSDNPADASRPVPCPPLIALQLRQMRDEAEARYAKLKRSAPDLFH